jgi:hypothetical protein
MFLSLLAPNSVLLTNASSLRICQTILPKIDVNTQSKANPLFNRDDILCNDVRTNQLLSWVLGLRFSTF